MTAPLMPRERVEALLLEINEGRVYKEVGPVAELTRQLAAELEEANKRAEAAERQLAAKTAECERLRESQREIAAALGVPGCDAAEMLNVIDSIREDAGRYRWLRCSPGGTMRDWLYMPHTEELDAAIDAERKRHDLR